MIRRATEADAPAISRVFVRCKDEMTYLPRIQGDIRTKFGQMFMDRYEIWVAEDDGAVVGFIGLGDDDMLEQIYVDPDAQNRGIGTELLEHTKSLRPERVQLWVFQKNEGARRLYERNGFRLVELTDGSGNMEGEPDARYEWTSGE